MHHKGIPLFVLLEYFVCVQGVPDLRTLPVSRCDGRSCNPSVGNLATGRTVSTLSSCGQNGSELYCSYRTGTLRLPAPKCGKCNAQHPGTPTAAHMTDDFFSNPDAWWQSAAVNREELCLDLETEFYLTHVIVLFRLPRPAP
ncbi:hypothetical protein AOXY_G23706 [Acipenser oxyrinchus oxyrinchus]|uniref:Laminin N-terminal domain-containing protein n=1 Tax=Acipenser oxyrinchus oxyrinchus TaxID=40147 RepID=A0AAD8CW20_ACIOX|nr:hypothetical protein AOXY_G23706 [Acipenser oxyrinchus oxyrinchus]